MLRGRTINGIGATDGITFVQGNSLHIENCVVSGFAGGAAINVTAASAKLDVVDSIVRNGTTTSSSEAPTCRERGTSRSRSRVRGDAARTWS